MNTNNTLLFNPISSIRSDCSYSAKKQVNFGQNTPKEPQKAKEEDSFIKSNVASLKFIMPKNYPYKEISKVFVYKEDKSNMEIKGEPAVVKSGDVDLNCWFVPPQPGKPTVLWCHGNAENITATQIVAKQLFEKGNGVMMVEYEGYGKNKGTPSENKLYQNAIDSAKYLNEKKQIPNNRIIVMGHSLGGPIAAHTAASVSEENHFKGVILDSTVPTMTHLVKSWIDNEYIALIDEPKENYSVDRVREDLKAGGGLFETEKSIPNIPKSTKILVIHSSRDNIVDETVGKKLMETVKASRPDAETYWEENSTKSHINYTCRIPKVLDFIDKLQDKSADINPAKSPKLNPIQKVIKFFKDKLFSH